MNNNKMKENIDIDKIKNEVKIIKRNWDIIWSVLAGVSIVASLYIAFIKIAWAGVTVSVGHPHQYSNLVNSITISTGYDLIMELALSTILAVFAEALIIAGIVAVWCKLTDKL